MFRKKTFFTIIALLNINTTLVFTASLKKMHLGTFQVERKNMTINFIEKKILKNKKKVRIKTVLLISF